MYPIAKAEQERILEIIGLARNSRLGEEFHEVLIKSNASVSEAQNYINSIFESYSQSVFLKQDFIYSIDKHISLFTQGYCSVVSPEEFLAGEICLFLSKVYGKIVYSNKPRPNFLKIFRHGDRYVITENLFYDRFPNVEYMGSFVPECLDYDTRQDERGGSSPVGRALANLGYAVKYTPLSPALIQTVKSRTYIDSDFELEIDVVEQQMDGVYKSDFPANLPEQLFQITAEYYNAIMSGDKWHKLDFLDEHSKINKKDIEYMFKDNLTLGAANNERTCLQRMVEGNSMSRHFDSNTSGVDNYLFNTITWVCEGTFSGRELVCGKRSKEDLSNWINGALSATSNLEAYGLNPVDYTDTCVISPENFKTVLVNSFNPMFYHGVNPLLGKGSVFTIINDFQPS